MEGGTTSTCRGNERFAEDRAFLLSRAVRFAENDASHALRTENKQAERCSRIRLFVSLKEFADLVASR